MLTEEQGKALLQLARRRIEENLGVAPRDGGEEPTGGVMQEKRGVFVTLHRGGNLRGCIGSLAATEPLVASVKRNAVNAAFHDLRFEPLTEAELDDLHVEVSILTEPRLLAHADADELLRLLRPNVDGVILQAPDGEQATFLPQVWRQLPLPVQFLGHLCRKAGLAENAWRSGKLRIYTYQVQSFEEPLSSRGQHP